MSRNSGVGGGQAMMQSVAGRDTTVAYSLAVYPEVLTVKL